MNRILPQSNRGHDELEILRKRSASVSGKDPCESLLNCFGHALNRLTRAEISQLRVRVMANFGEGHAFIEILDGHVALRDALGMA